MLPDNYFDGQRLRADIEKQATLCHRAAAVVDQNGNLRTLLDGVKSFVGRKRARVLEQADTKIREHFRTLDNLAGRPAPFEIHKQRGVASHCAANFSQHGSVGSEALTGFHLEGMDAVLVRRRARFSRHVGRRGARYRPGNWHLCIACAQQPPQRHVCYLRTQIPACGVDQAFRQFFPPALLAHSVVAGAGQESVADFPTRPVKIVVPNPPGSGTDLLARLLADQLSRRWSKAVIVENQSGIASGNVAAADVARSTPMATR